MAKIRKAVITAAGAQQQALPLQTLVDRDGETKTVLRIIVDEVVRANIEEIAVVVSPDSKDAYRRAAGEIGKTLRFVEQPQAQGYAQAVYTARDFIQNDPFLHLVGDHLYVSAEQRGCAEQLVAIAEEEGCSVSAVQATREFNLPHYGAIGGQRLAERKGLYRVEQIIEKPTPTEAEQQLVIPGLRAGSYLCFFGMHVFSPLLMELLSKEFNNTPSEAPQHLSEILDQLAKNEQYLACELSGRRYEIAAKYGLFEAQLALAMEGEDQNEILSKLLDFLATRQLQVGQ